MAAPETTWAARTHTFALTKIQPPRPRTGLVERLVAVAGVEAAFRFA